MKKGFILSIAGAAVTVATVALVVTSVLSAPSKYEGRTVKDIEFVGVKKLGLEKEEIVPLRVLKGMSILKDEFTHNAQIGAGKPDFVPLFIGQAFTQDKVRDTIKLLFERGNLYNVRVEAQELGDGVKVKVFCEERPLVSQLVFKGLDKVQEADLKDKVFLKAGSPFRQDLLDRSIEPIRKKYFDSGLANCVLTYKVEVDKKKDDGSVIVSIIVDEGEDLRVEKITILGAKSIPAYELKAFLETKEKGLLNEGTFKQDAFKTDKEKILLYYKQNGYLDADFADEQGQISYEWGDPDKKEERARSIYITFKIVEGERYYFDGYHFSGVTGTVGKKEKGTDITTEKLEKMMELRAKDVSPLDKAAAAVGFDDDTDTICDNTLFEKDRHAISFLYASQGHVFSRVTPARKTEEREKVVNGKKVTRKYVSFDLDVYEGSEARIEKIFIRGCKKTKEYVVRREVLMKEDVNELFDSYKVQRTRENIYNLGFFKEVNIEMRPGSTGDKLNILIDVQEQPTGSISLGGGYGTGTGFSIFADLGDKNFMGRGEAVNLRVEYGPSKVSGTLSYTMPWIFNLPISFESAVYYALTSYETSTLFSSIASSSDTSSYKLQKFGYYMGPTYRFWYYYSIGMIWDQSWSSVLNPSGNSPDSVFTQEKLGIQQERKLKFKVARNSVDNNFYPTRGINSSFAVTFVGGEILGGNSHFIKYDPGVEMYYTPFHLPFLDKYPCVFEFRASGSFMAPPVNRSKVQSMQDRFYNDWLKTEDRLTIGGPPGYGTSAVLRGWEYNTDPLPASWQEGLFHSITYGTEFRVPIQPQYLWFVMFFDAGSLWSDRFWEQTLTDSQKYTFENDKESGNLYDIRDIGKANLMSYFRYSYGFGFKVQIPMMPLRFWFAQKALWNGERSAPFKKVGGITFQFSIGDFTF